MRWPAKALRSPRSKASMRTSVTTELRAAFTREHALQCGYCTPGMLVSARDLVLRLPQADERLIRVGLSGNLCRCTGYVGIVRAVQSVIEARRARDIAPIPGGGRKILGPVGSGRSAHRRSGPSRAHARRRQASKRRPKRPVRSLRFRISSRPPSWSSSSASRTRPNRCLRCSATSQPSRPAFPARR